MEILAVIQAGFALMSKLVDLQIARMQGMTPEQRVIDNQNFLDIMKPGMDVLRVISGLMPPK